MVPASVYTRFTQILPRCHQMLALPLLRRASEADPAPQGQWSYSGMLGVEAAMHLALSDVSTAWCTAGRGARRKAYRPDMRGPLCKHKCSCKSGTVRRRDVCSHMDPRATSRAHGYGRVCREVGVVLRASRRHKQHLWYCCDSSWRGPLRLDESPC